MAVFRYQALDPGRGQQTGELEARSYDEALRRLHALGYSVRRLDEVVDVPRPEGPSRWKRYRLGVALALVVVGSSWAISSLGGGVVAPASAASPAPPASLELRVTGRVEGGRPVDLRLSFPELGEGVSLSSRDGSFDEPVSVSRRPTRAELLARAPGFRPARLVVEVRAERIELPALVLQAERPASPRRSEPAPGPRTEPVAPRAPYPGAVR